ncbi:MAG TPA: hypothetical protein VJ984_06935 [Xanthomonadales bacterium]|nr:hypothetical protein [Xanthomonadales bacterium]
MIRKTAIVVFVVSAIVWVYALTQHTFLLDEIWLYVGFFLIPIAAICAALWFFRLRNGWWKLLGTLLLIISVLVWLSILLLVSGGFKIH